MHAENLHYRFTATDSLQLAALNGFPQPYFRNPQAAWNPLLGRKQVCKFVESDVIGLVGILKTLPESRDRQDNGPPNIGQTCEFRRTDRKVAGEMIGIEKYFCNLAPFVSLPPRLSVAADAATRSRR